MKLTVPRLRCTRLGALALLGAVVHAGACAHSLQSDVDSVYLDGAVYLVDANNSWAEAIAVSNGRIVAVGKNDEIEALRGPSTRVVDLGGRMVMPGIQDMHGHPMQAGDAHFYQCSFPFSYTMEQIVAKVRSCAAGTPKGAWIRGGQWAQELLVSKTVPHRAILDAITTDHPVFLGDSTVHDAWLNSKALEAMGIDRRTPNPAGGVIDRDAAGDPTGILHDNATFRAMHTLPARTPEEYATAARWAMQQMNAVGVTSIKDALVDSHALRAYRDLDRAGDLTMRVATSLAWKASWTEPHERELENIASRGDYRTDRIGTDFIKIFLDGIPPTRTAAMLDPYLPDATHGNAFTGHLIHTPADLTADVTALDRQGLTVKVHATGDRAVRVALDAFEAARMANGASDRRHEISHAELVHPSDIPRFKALNVAAEMCPILWYRSPLVEVMAGIVGETKANRFWPTRSLVESGALVIYGSDWPSVVPDPSPWPGIESMVTRRDPYSNGGEPLWAEQAIDLASVIRIFTQNGAIAARLGDQAGSLAVGKAADFIVLDRNIFRIPIEQVSETRVVSTVIAGEEVYATQKR